MPRIQITKVILTKGDKWALIEYRTAEDSGKVGGTFGCLADTLVPGQYFKGSIKRDRQGRGKFVGVPISREDNSLKHALKKAGINWTDRAALFAKYKSSKMLFSALENKKSRELMSIQKIGRKKLERIYGAYDMISNELSMSKIIAQTLPSLNAYLNKNQVTAILDWFDHKMEKFVEFVIHDPWRIMYNNEFDSFTYEDFKRDMFLKATTSKSREKMCACAMKDLKLTIDDPRGSRVLAIHTLRQFMKKSGSYWMPLNKFLFSRGVSEIDPTWPCVVRDGHVALIRFAEVECYIEKTFASICADYRPCNWTPPDETSNLDKTQRAAVTRACEEPLFILNGGAGTGKTTVSAQIVRSLGREKVLCAAPTGKAAQRLSQVTGIEAYTVHRLVYMSEDRCLELPRILLLDEQSMQEPEILAKLFFRKSFTKIIFVGDIAQLTSVGPGQFFKDICGADIPTIELKQIYRSSDTSYIASNGQKIRIGDTRLDYSEDSFVVRPYNNIEEIVEMARDIYNRTRNMPMVLCNTNNEVAQLNKPLREICNPLNSMPDSGPVNMDYSGGEWRYDKWRFMIGDSVINIQNQYSPIEENGEKVAVELKVANGEIGIVRQVGKNHVVVEFDHVWTYDLKEEPALRPAYALTVNKSQGSEYPIVIVKSSTSWGDKRERFYTAITRAKEKCIVYEVGSANSDCIRAKPAYRKTFLLKN